METYPASPRKLTRTISGVAPVAVMTPPLPCPGQCIYCPTFPTTPQSYTTESPAVLRARRNGYNPALQVQERLHTLEAMGHPVDKIELIIMGGTFPALPQDFQHQFVRNCFQALNGEPAPSLKEAQRLNEQATHRCVGLCVETRPDYCGPQEIALMLELGVTRVELGVQTLDEEVYRRIKRGHSVAQVVEATRLLKDSGFKVYYHWMPALPGSTPEKDLELAQRLFADPAFRPDGLKLYPTLVVEGTELEKWWRQGWYQPYTQEKLVELLLDIKASLPPYVRLARVMRDIPSKFILAGARDSALRQALHRRLKERGLECRCTRCREYGHRLKERWPIGQPRLKRLDYDASSGRECFLSAEDEGGTLFALLRLRFPFRWDSAIVRELHTFGPELPLGQRRPGAAQHLGLGRMLLKEAERLAREELGAKRLAVLSGVGARDYFRDSGYSGEGAYMVKEL